MEEFNFKRAELEDKEIISDYFRRYPSRSCERTFVNVFLWSRKYPVKWAVIDRTLVFKSEDEEHLSFAFPTGEEEDIKKVLPVLKAYCEERGYPFTMYNVTPENMKNWKNGFRESMKLSTTVIWQIMYMRWRSLRRCPGKSFTAKEIILINSRRCMKTAGVMRK